jgi:RNA polymerase sigma-70 factor (sigma-E family)
MMTTVAHDVQDETLRDLFDGHYRGLVRLAALLVDDRGAAEEIVQDAFVGAAARWDRIDGEKALAYLRSSVLNGARDALRRRGTVRRFLSRQSERNEPPPAVEGPEATAVSHVTRREVLEAVRRLPETQRNVVLLRYFLDCSEAQIAETLGVSAGTVKTSAHRALANLAPALEALR